jgi:hypothetical protein
MKTWIVGTLLVVFVGIPVVAGVLLQLWGYVFMPRVMWREAGNGERWQVVVATAFVWGSLAAFVFVLIAWLARG